MSFWSTLGSIFGLRTSSTADSAGTSFNLADATADPTVAKYGPLAGRVAAPASQRVAQAEGFNPNLGPQSTGQFVGGLLSAPFVEATHIPFVGAPIKTGLGALGTIVNAIDHGVAAELVGAGNELRNPGLSKHDWSHLFDSSYANSYPTLFHNVVANHVSPGQGAAYALSFGKLPNPSTSAANEARYSHGLPEWLSGAADAGLQWFLNPGVIGGKAVRAGAEASIAKAGTTVAAHDALAVDLADHAEWRATDGTAGRQTAAGKLADSLASGDYSKNYQTFSTGMNPITANPAGWARITADIKDPEQIGLLLRAGVGDQRVINQLMNDHPMAGTPFAKLVTNKDPLIELAAQSDAAVAAGTHVNVGGAMHDLLPPEIDFQGLHAALQAGVAKDYLDHYYEDMAKQDQGFADLQDAIASGGGLDNLGSKFGYVQDMKDWFNTQSAERQRLGGWFSQAHTGPGGMFGRTFRFITYLGDSVPSGWVRLRGVGADMDSTNEIRAWLAQVPAPPEWRQEKLNEWGSLSVHGDKLQFLSRMQDEGISRIIRNTFPDADEEQLVALRKKFLEEHERRFRQAWQNLTGRDYLHDPISGEDVKVDPAVVAQLTPMAPLFHFKEFGRAVHTFSGGVAGGELHAGWHNFYSAMNAGSTMATAFYKVWRPATLLRLGYTQRNVAEGWLRALAYQRRMTNTAPFLWGRDSVTRQAGDNFGLWLSKKATRSADRLGWTSDKTAQVNQALDEAKSVLAAKQARADGIIDDLTAQPVASGGAGMLPDEYYNQFSGQVNTRLRKGLLPVTPNVVAARAAEDGVGEKVALRRILDEARASGHRVVYRAAKDRSFKYVNGELPGNAIFDFVRNPDKGVLIRVVPSHESVVREAIDNGEQLADHVAQVYADSSDPIISGHLAYKAALEDDLALAKQETAAAGHIADQIGQSLEARNARRTPVYSKRGAFRQPRTYTFKDGSTVERPAWADSPDGLQMRLGASADPSVQMAVAGPENNWRSGINEKLGEKKIEVGDPNYFGHLEHIVNNQWKDKLYQIFIHGGSLQDAVDWLESSNGRGYLANMRSIGDERDAFDVAHGAFQEYRTFLPSERLRERLANGEHLYAADLKARLEGSGQLVPIRGGIKDATRNDWLGTAPHRMTNRLFNALGTLPENRLVRFPFAMQQADGKMRDLVAKYAEYNGNQITLDAWDRMEHEAVRYGVRQTRKWLYTVERYSHMANGLRYLSPFFASTENSLKVWSQLVARDPSVLARGALLIHGMYEHADSNGNMTVPIPVRFIPGPLGKSLQDHAILGIPVQGLESIVLGNTPAWSPGVGPSVAIPANYLVEHDPNLGQFAQKSGILPFGTSTSYKSQVLPPWMQRLVSLWQGVSDPGYSTAYMQTWAYEMAQYRDGKRATAPTLAEVQDRTSLFYKMRAIASAVLPFGPQFQTSGKFYLDKLHQMEQQDPVNGYSNFLTQYPEWYGYTVSASQNSSGVQPGLAQFNILKNNTQLVSELGNISPSDPSLIGMLTNDSAFNNNSYNNDVYNYLKTTKISKSDNIPYVTSATPAQMMQRANVSLGWNQYTAFVGQLTTILHQRGLNSFSDSGAADLEAAKKAYVQQASGMNYDWYQSYLNAGSGSAVSDALRAVDVILSNKKFMASPQGQSPKWQYMASYLQGRDEFQQVLAQRAAAGGSASLTATSNADIAQAWSAYTTQLSSSNTDFAYMFNRYFSGDNLTAQVVPAQ